MANVVNDNNEIDLVELISTLWKKKWTIIASAAVCTILAAGYAFTAKEQWTSKATVIEPKVADLSNYLSLHSEYANILDDKNFTSKGAIDNLFSHFKTTLFSNNIKREFFAQSKWFEQYATETSNATEDEKQKLLSTILEKHLIITVPDLKKNPNALGINISFSTETPSNAQAVLTEYINFVNESVLAEDKVDFLTDIRITVDNLKLQKDKIERDTENVRQVQLENLTTALKIAQTAGIKEYSRTAGDINIPQVALGDAQIPFSDSKLSDGAYLFMLGEKYLQAQVDTLTKNKIVYPVAFYTIEKQLSLLKTLEEKVERGNISNSYYYLSSPDYPVQRDWPKRVILLLLGMVFGGIIGCVWILGKLILGNRNE